MDIISPRGPKHAVEPTVYIHHRDCATRIGIQGLCHQPTFMFPDRKSDCAVTEAYSLYHANEFSMMSKNYILSTGTAKRDMCNLAVSHVPLFASPSISPLYASLALPRDLLERGRV